MKRKRVLSVLFSVMMVCSFFCCFPSGEFETDFTLVVEAANVENIVARADYLYSIKWTPLKTIYGYGKGKTFEAGKSYRLPYGMPVNTGTFIGYDISIDNFIKKTKDSSSLMYTSSSGWSDSSYSNAWYCPYYSMDCSTFVSWCWGLSSRQTTYGLEKYGTYIGACTKANVSKLKLGDALNSSSHVGLVTGISDGKYEITEMTPPVLYRETFTASELAASKWNGYNILRPTNYKTNTLTINYHTNGGTIATNEKYYAKDGKIYKKSDNTLVYQKWEYGKGREEDGLFDASTLYVSRKGYTFLGWSTSKSGGTIYDEADGSLTSNDLYPDIATKSGTVTLYAQWKKNILTMNYNTNGGTIAENDTYYVVSGGNIYRKSDSKVFSVKWGYDYVAEKGLYDAATFKLSRPGYTFLGWSTSKSDGTVYSQTDNTIRAETLFPNIYTKSGKVTLYAQWKKNILTMNYNTNGGTIAENDTYYAVNGGNIYRKSDSKIFSVKWGYDYVAEKGLYNAATFKLSRPGYTFLGWSTSKSGGTVYSQTDNTIRAKTLFPNIYTKSGTVTLYAQWTANKYTVTFKPTGGTCEPTSKSVTYNSTYGDLPKPTRTGYTFKGWFTAENGGKKITKDSTVTITADQTLYAQWQKNEVVGDVNADGTFGVADIVLLQKWLLDSSDAKLADSKKADMNKDGRLDAFDLCVLKRELLKNK